MLKSKSLSSQHRNHKPCPNVQSASTASKPADTKAATCDDSLGGVGDGGGLQDVGVGGERGAACWPAAAGPLHGGVARAPDGARLVAAVGERRAFLLPALEASWPIGGAPSPRTLGDSSEGNHPISEDARRLLGREQLAAGESTGTCGGEEERKGKEGLPLPALEASWPIGGGPISEDARRLLGRESPHLRGR